VFSSDLPGVNPATLNEMILYYRLMPKWSGVGDSTELSRLGLSQTIQISPISSPADHVLWRRKATSHPIATCGASVRIWNKRLRRSGKLARGAGLEQGEATHSDFAADGVATT
jgi:hypothetical protein